MTVAAAAGGAAPAGPPASPRAEPSRPAAANGVRCLAVRCLAVSRRPVSRAVSRRKPARWITITSLPFRAPPPPSPGDQQPGHALIGSDRKWWKMSRLPTFRHGAPASSRCARQAGALHRENYGGQDERATRYLQTAQLSGGHRLAAVWRGPIPNRAPRNNPPRVDLRVGAVVMTLDVVEVGGLAERRLLVEVAGVSP